MQKVMDIRVPQKEDNFRSPSQHGPLAPMNQLVSWLVSFTEQRSSNISEWA